MKKTVLLGALVAVMLLGIVGAAFADSVTYNDDALEGTATNSGDPVLVSATVNPKITLTVDTPDDSQSVDFGPVDPGDTDSKTVNLTVNSNMQFDLSASHIGGVPLGFSRSLTGATDHAKGAAIPFSDIYTINVPVDTAPGTYTATVTYSVVQD